MVSLKVCPRCASTDLRIQGSRSTYCSDCDLGKWTHNGGGPDDYYNGSFPELEEEDLEAFKEHLHTLKNKK